MLALSILLIFLYLLIGLHDRRGYKSAPRRDRVVYICLAAYTVYMCVDSVLDIDLVHLYSLVEDVFGPAARGIVRMLEASIP